MELFFIQAFTNLVSLITITVFTKKLFLQHDTEFMKKWYITGLIFSDGILAIGRILIIGDAWKYDNESNWNPCKFQGFLIHWGMMSSFMWINVIVLIIYNSLNATLNISARKTFLLCMGAPFGYCLL